MSFDEAALQTVRKSRLLIDRYDSWLFEEFNQYLGKRIVEIGCGLGNQIVHFVDRELVVGIDSSKESVSEVQSRFEDFPNIKFFNLSIVEPLVLSLGEYQFDTAISVNVFEHIEEDDLAILNSWQLLQTNGLFILIVPAHPWLFGTMDSSIGHYRRYSRNLLNTKLERVGFCIIEQKYLNVLGALGWFVNGKILRRRVPPVSQLRMINMVTPILRTFEKYFHPPFGISLLTIAKRNL